MLATSYILVSVMLFLFSYVKRWRILEWISYFCFLASFLAVIPLPGEDKVMYVSPTQVVFRFDEHRYLQLTGSRCEGRLYYIDEQAQIYSELARHSARVLTEPFAHMPGDYIFVPNDNYSGIDYSRDGGRTFNHMNVFERRIGYVPRPQNNEGMVVVNNQFFLKTQNQGIFRSPKPFGTGAQFELLSPANEEYLKNHNTYTGPRWADRPIEMPTMPEDYTGWHKWRCDLSLKQEMKIYNRYAPLHELQADLRQVLGLSTQGGK